MAALLDEDRLFVAKHYLTGCAAALAKVVSGHPFDTMKVRCQATTGQSDLVSIVSRTLKREGPLAFYKGVSPVLPGLLMYNSMLFATFGQVTRALSADPANLTLSQITLGGACAGGLVSILTSPMEMVRSRLQLQGLHKPLRRGALYQYTLNGLLRQHPFFQKRAVAKMPLQLALAPPVRFRGPVDVVRKSLRFGGVSGFFRGLPVTMCREVPGNTAYFAAFEGMLRLMGYGVSTGLASDAPPLAVLVAGGVAGVSNWIIVYPIDTVKSRYQTDDMRKPKFRSAWHCLKWTVRTQGPAALWRGVVPCLIRAFVANGAGFLAVNSARKALFAPGELVR